MQGKGRLYPAYSLSGSEGETDVHESPAHYRSLRRQPPPQPQQPPPQQPAPTPPHPLAAAAAANPYQHHTYQTPYHHQYQPHPAAANPYQHHTYQTPYHHQYQPHPAGLSDTPTSENASDATLTDSELALARDSTLLVHNAKIQNVNAMPKYCECV